MLMVSEFFVRIRRLFSDQNRIASITCLDELSKKGDLIPSKIEILKILKCLVSFSVLSFYF